MDTVTGDKGVMSPDYKYFPAIIVGIVVGALLVLAAIMFSVQQYVRRKPKAAQDAQSYYPDDFYTGYNKRRVNTRGEAIEEEVEKDSSGDKDDDLESGKREPIMHPQALPRIRTESAAALPRPETLYSPTRPNSTLLLDEFVAPLFDNNSNNHSQSNLLKSSQHSHE
ncbi:hypothetical protein E3P99_01078 [Wallemia hederae]|uniref:Uncharacterized protein n=1 Tax=Wallemia hederae TaxID=1540922 RepID=A0A4T0FT23_9BASI|nr:hypothetical protein E3P99_01078 [Wallemia hederae]